MTMTSVPPLRWLAALSLPLLLCGCANLGAVQEFGQLAADRALYGRVTDDFLASTQLQQDLTLKRQESERQQIEAAHAQRQAVADGALLMQAALSRYMEALADLADDDLVVLDAEVQELANAAAKAELLDANQAGAVGGIGALLSEAALNGYRQRQLTRVIEQGNAPLQALVKHIKTMMVVYERQLVNDQERFRQHFNALDTMAGTTEPVAAQLAWMEQRMGARAFAPRRAALAQYIETIEGIGVAHQALYDNRGRISDSEVRAQLKRYIKRIRAARAAARGE